MSNVRYVFDRITPHTQFIKSNEELIFLYLTNDEGIGLSEIEQLSRVLISQLSLFINFNTNTFDDIHPITVPLLNNGRNDLLMVIEKKELKGIKIVDTLDYSDLIKAANRREYYINYFLRGANTETPNRLTITKECEGLKQEVLEHIESQISRM